MKSPAKQLEKQISQAIGLEEVNPARDSAKLRSGVYAVAANGRSKVDQVRTVGKTVEAKGSGRHNQWKTPDAFEYWDGTQWRPIK